MSKPDFNALLATHDKGDMAGYTRRFVDDLEVALGAAVEVDADMDWSGVLCLGMGGSGAGGMFLQPSPTPLEDYHSSFGETTVFPLGGGLIGWFWLLLTRGIPRRL